MMLICTSVMAQVRTVSGVVTDNNGLPLPGASVQVKETGNGTIADSLGAFIIRVPENGATFVVSSVDMVTQEVPISGTTVNISLAPSATALEDVVVIGYGSVRRTDVTGSVATISTKDFQKGTITSFDQMIAGKAPGVAITSSGGRPGEGATIRVRGLSSLNGSNDPLIVVDGAPFDGYVNPNDIETVTVLKDAASTAIYGSRASSGVILITTKQGSRGKMRINFNTLASVGQVPKLVDVLNADEFRNYVNNNFSDEYKALLGNANTNWQKEIYQSAFTSNSNLSVSGTTGNLPYRVSVGYLSQEGVLKTDKMDRATGALRLTPKFFNGSLKTELNVNGSLTKRRNANQGAIGAAVSFDPTQPVRDEAEFADWGGYFQWLRADGTPNPLGTMNPVALLQQKNDISHYNRVFGNIKLDYELPFAPGLHLIANGGLDHGVGYGNTVIDANARESYEVTPNYTYRGLKSEFDNDFTNTFVEYTANYIKDIASIKSNINAMFTYGFYDYQNTWRNFPSFDTNDSLRPNSTPAFPTGLDENTLISYVGRLIYTYDDKYTLTASLRRDGSSRFAEDVRWGLFPSIALGWNVKREAFLENAEILNDLKLRLSHGVTGNQGGIGNYTHIPSFYLSDLVSQYMFGNSYYRMYTPRAYDASLKWEQTASTNFGIDFGFFKNRINGSLDIYNKDTRDLLSVVNLPVGTNYTNQLLTNIGTMRTQGAELALNVVPVRTVNTEWSFGFNVSRNEIEITNLTANDDPSFKGVQIGTIQGATGQTIQIHSVGQTPFSYLVHKQIYDQATDLPIEGLYLDLNRDGNITLLTDQYYYQSAFPKWIMAFNTNLRHKKWNINTVLRSNIGNYNYNNVASNLGVSAGMHLNQYLQNAVRDLFSTNFVDRQFHSDYYVQNASFLRMDNLGISYDFGRILNDKAALVLTGNIQNVFVITKYKGLDPEVNYGIDNNIYPRPRVYSIGLNLNF